MDKRSLAQEGQIKANGILIVDDSAFMRLLVKDILRRNSIKVVGEAQNGIEAVQLYKDLRPDLVTMDITMLEKNGIEATIEILKLDPFAKIIMCSAMGQEGMIKAAIKAGAREFIIKPINEEMFMDVIRRLL